MSLRRRGRHQSTCKAGKKTLAALESIPGVAAVIIGRSYGGKSIGKGHSAGYFKLQREVEGGFRGLLQSSRGVQEIFIRVAPGSADKVRKMIRVKFPQG